MRKDQHDVRVSVDGVDLATFDKLTGGQIDSSETTYQLGGMGPRVSLGGHVTPGNVTVEVLYDLQRLHPLVHWLISRVGKGAMVVKKQPLDPDGNAYGRPITYSGILKQVIPPEVDSETADAALLGLELTTAGTVT
jgi:hypothetical protein